MNKKIFCILVCIISLISLDIIFPWGWPIYNKGAWVVKGSSVLGQKSAVLQCLERYQEQRMIRLKIN